MQENIWTHSRHFPLKDKKQRLWGSTKTRNAEYGMETEKGGVLRAHGQLYAIAMDVSVDSNSDQVSFLILCSLLLYTDIERMKVFMTISVKVLLSFFHFFIILLFIHCSFLCFNIFVCIHTYIYIYIYNYIYI